jgi:outer membrane protein assembly factor BamA
MRSKIRLVACQFLALSLNAAPLTAQEQEQAATADESPWLITPTLSSDPKLGTTVGGVVGYINRFDPGSNQSLVTLFGTYSDTDSHVVGLAGDMYFNNNQHKVAAGLLSGKIYNEYDDFLGTGASAETEDSIDALFLRYSYLLGGHWYLGGQLISSNYAIGAEGALGDFLGQIGLTGFDSTGIGLVGERDTRDNIRNPSQGSHFTVHNIAYRESLGGDESFDVYRAEFNQYLPFGDGHVLATQLTGRWTDGAPLGGYSSVKLRGYTQGNYLDKHYSHVDVDARFSLGERWGLAVFAGLGCLYASGSDCGDSESLYPAIGGGVIYLLKPEAGFVIRAEFAKGEGDNSALYLRLGQPF